MSDTKTRIVTFAAWRIEYNNDTGPNDEGFCEWWTVGNGTRSFKCDRHEDAEWLCGVLNRMEETR